MQSDVLIIGGGVIGLTTAYFLAREGAHVRVVDQGDIGQESSWAGAGILVPASVDAARTPLDRLHAQSVGMLPGLSAELKERTGIDNGYLKCGGIEFVNDADPVDEWRREGVAAELLDEVQLREREPALAGGLGRAFFLPDMAQLRNPRHMQALRAACEQVGVALQPHCPVQGFDREGSRVTAVRTATGPIPAGKFLIAAGAWSDRLLDAFDWRPGIHPVRGQIVLLNTGVPILRSILLAGKRYLVPRPDGRVLIGSTEEDVGFDKRTTEEAIADLLGLASMLVPALGNAAAERCWSGLRPGTLDGLPYIGSVPGVENVFVASGHFRSGIQLSAGTALVMKELLLGQELTVSIEAFALQR